MSVVRALRLTLLSGIWVLPMALQSAAATSYPHVQGLIQDARELRIAGSFDEAEGKLARAQRIAPRSADVYLEYAYLRKDQGDFADLKNVVGVGADVSDGPPRSLAQLKILQKNLSALSLPVTPRENFSTPPAIAEETRSTPRTIASSQLDRSNSDGRSSDLSSQRLEAAEPAARLLSSEQSVRVDVYESVVEPVGETRLKNQEIRVADSARPENKPVSSDQLVRGRDKDSSVEFIEETLVKDQEIRVADSTRPDDKASAESVREFREASMGRSSQNQVDPTKRPTNESLRPTTEPAIVAADEVGVVTEKSLNKGSTKVAAGTGTIFTKTRFVGLGILASPQSGTWMSRGPVETDY